MSETAVMIPCVGGPLDGRSYPPYGTPLPERIEFPVSDPYMHKAIWLEENEEWPVDEWGRPMYKDAQGNWKRREYGSARYRLEETATGPVYRFEGMRQ